MPARKPAAEPVSDVEEINDMALPESYTPLISPVRKSMIPELYRFVRGLSPDHPYHELASAAQSAGWIWRMTETECNHGPNGLVMVRFRVEIGKATSDMSLEYFDTITMMVPQEAPSPSLIARLNAQVALTYMVFGRLPPAAAPVPQPVPAPVEQPEPVEEDVPWQKPSRREEPKQEPLKLLERYTPDGLPVIADPYEIGRNPDELVDAIMEIFEDHIDRPQNRAAVTAMYNKNQSAAQFVADFGSLDQQKRLKNMFRDKAASFN